MKITLLGSMHFSTEMLHVKEQLEKMEHIVNIPEDIHECFIDPESRTTSDKDYEKELKYCIEKSLLKDAMKKIEKSDAVLVLNYTKNDIEGYIGAAVLMGMGVAFYLEKKIYLLNEVDKTQKYALEVNLTRPFVLEGDLSKIG